MQPTLRTESARPERFLQDLSRAPSQNVRRAVSVGLLLVGGGLLASAKLVAPHLLAYGFVGTIWLGMLLFRLLDSRRLAPTFFGGAPPRFSWLDILVASSLFVGRFDVGSLGVFRIGGIQQPLFGVSLSLGLATSIMSLRVARWAYEARTLTISGGSEVRAAGFLTGVEQESGWSVRRAPRGGAWRAAPREVEQLGYRVSGSTPAGHARSSDHDPGRGLGHLDSVSWPRSGALTELVAPLPDALKGTPQGEGLSEPVSGVAHPMHGPGPGIFVLAPLVGWLVDVITFGTLPSAVGTALALIALSFWKRPGKATGLALVLERSADGPARWLPLALTWAVTMAATWAWSTGMSSSPIVKGGCVAIIAYAWTFIADRLTRDGRQLFLPVDDNYFCRSAPGGWVPTATTPTSRVRCSFEAVASRS